MRMQWDIIVVFTWFSIQNYEDKMQEAMTLVFTSISKPYLDELLSNLEKTLKEGIKLSCPSGKPGKQLKVHNLILGPAYQYSIQLSPSNTNLTFNLPLDVFVKKLNNIKNRTFNFDANIEDQIKSFTFSRRLTLPTEMMKYLVLLQKSSFKEESKLRRVCKQ